MGHIVLLLARKEDNKGSRDSKDKEETVDNRVARVEIKEEMGIKVDKAIKVIKATTRVAASTKVVATTKVATRVAIRAATATAGATTAAVANSRSVAAQKRFGPTHLKPHVGGLEFPEPNPLVFEQGRPPEWLLLRFPTSPAQCKTSRRRSG